MYKRNNMLREKRKHANYKPNRRLDAKSSRGMIYENEELRIRTININADVERGQSEIKTLKREREQLRREIWTLRDEYDKLENLLRIKGIDPDEFLNQNKNNNVEDEDDDNLSDCSECSCESCCEDECCEEGKTASQHPAKADEATNDTTKSEVAGTSTSKGDTQQPNGSAGSKSVDEHGKRPGKDRLNLNFDHLSVVSEENSEANSNIQNEDSSIPIHDLSAFLHSADVISPLSYLQKLNPPLTHFENLNYEQIGGSNVDRHGNILLTEKFTKPNGKEVPPVPVEPAKKESRLKHFFSPIRRKNSTQLPPPPPPLPPTVPSHPDVFINNILPANMYVNPMHLQASSLPESSRTKAEAAPMGTASPTSSFQTGGNLEELLFDIEALSKDIMDLQTQCTNSPTDNEPVKKPFRSELNLILSYPKPPDSDGNTQITPPVPAPMELMIPASQNNPLLLHNLPSPFPSIPCSPLTPPTNFNMNEMNVFDKDFSHLKFTPINAPAPAFASNNSIFCTVSAPSTPASDRKCIDKFLVNEGIAEGSKKKSKRVSIVNSKDEAAEKAPETPETSDSKEGDKKLNVDTSNANHHSHTHHSHSHLHPKRRMSLDNTVNSSRHKNHRQISNDPNARVQRRESNRSSNSFRKRSRSDSAFGGHGDLDQGGTSMSERYSNSIASSRESSTSLSLKSGKRRISITSYGGSKKIPWCGCWGNSCI